MLTQEMVKKMARAPMILALANPEPEILPPLAKEVRPDAIICTGRSDYPNQVNNVLCFPFIFPRRSGRRRDGDQRRDETGGGPCDCRAGACRTERSGGLGLWRSGSELWPGIHYSKTIRPASDCQNRSGVAKAAMDSGVATRPIADFDAYIDKLTEFVYKTNLFMKPIFSQARKDPKRVVLPEGGRGARAARDPGVDNPGTGEAHPDSVVRA
ncbi:NADP-dependent malate dehydrogenase [Salmonella enterica subsp. arizonae]|uniref:NADP-dependent malate dehydrogenase n=1 Tax=Salmonella enterica subsp. arizonae TaxID=59203 RepID=A0A379T7A9_SALER|nr:NADP-dependent malate dehydrogenase [Salmonella enterica subsp. arizonae]